MEKDLEKKYAELKEKHKLPSYDEINRDFELYSISKDEDVLRETLKKMNGVVDYYISLLEDIIQPDSRFYILKEANVLNKEQRKIVTTLYNKLLYLNRSVIEIHLNYSDEKASELINIIFNEWQTIKQELLQIITTLKDSWSKNTEIKPDRGYFG